MRKNRKKRQLSQTLGPIWAPQGQMSKYCASRAKLLLGLFCQAITVYKLNGYGQIYIYLTNDR